MLVNFLWMKNDDGSVVCFPQTSKYTRQIKRLICLLFSHKTQRRFDYESVSALKIVFKLLEENLDENSFATN